MISESEVLDLEFSGGGTLLRTDYVGNAIDQRSYHTATVFDET